MTDVERAESIRYKMTLILGGLEELCRRNIWNSYNLEKWRIGDYSYPRGKEYKRLNRLLYPRWRCWRLSNKFLKDLWSRGYAVKKVHISRSVQ